MRGSSGGGGRRPGPTAGRGRGQVGGSEPSADRLGTGPGDLWPLIGEHHADQLRPPSRVIATQGEDRLADLFGMSMIESRGGSIAGQEAGISLLACSLQEMTNGAWREIEEPGQRGHGFALARSLPDFLTDRNRDGFGHRSRLRIRVVKIRNAHPFQHATRPLAKPQVRINPAKPTER